MVDSWSSTEFKEILTELRDSNHIKNHPYFDLWSQGKLSKKDMAQYVLQHKLWSSQVVNMWGIVVAKSSENTVQNFFLENIQWYGYLSVCFWSNTRFHGIQYLGACYLYMVNRDIPCKSQIHWLRPGRWYRTHWGWSWGIICCIPIIKRCGCFVYLYSHSSVSVYSIRDCQIRG